MQSSITPETHRSENIEKNSLKNRRVALQPLAMRIFNSEGIYFPSKLRPKKMISYEEFISDYADYPINILVCFDDKPSSDTMLERAEFVTAYGFGLGGCYIIASDTVETAP